MNKTQTRQLAELAIATRDADLLTKACQLLLAEADKPEALPLWSQPIMATTDGAATLHQALDNLPPLVVKQPPVQRVERGSFTPDWHLGAAVRAWRHAFQDAWRTNSEAIGAHQHVNAYNAQLHTFVRGAVEAGEDMPARTAMRLFWSLAKVKPVAGYRIEHRQRDMGGYTVNEHRILLEGEAI